jgi:hypothetical protein
MTAFLHEICSSQVDNEPVESVSAYIGSLHLKPISRLWNTSKDNLTIKTPIKEGRKKTALKKKKGFSLNYIESCLLPNLYDLEKNAEKAEVKIAKHALLEALFQT